MRAWLALIAKGTPHEDAMRFSRRAVWSVGVEDLLWRNIARCSHRAGLIGNFHSSSVWNADELDLKETGSFGKTNKVAER